MTKREKRIGPWHSQLYRTISFLLAAVMVLTLLPVSLMSFEADAASNEQTVYNYLTGTMNLNQAAACGVVANIYCESGFNPNATGDSGTSYGICQWHDSRWTALKNYCSNNGYDWTTLNGQLHYLQYELVNSYPGVYSTLTSVSNTADGAYNAAYKWCYSFEIPANYPSVSVTRGNLARDTYWPQYGTDEPQGSSAQTADFISRSDGVWYWPLPQSYYNSFSDWAGCHGYAACPFHNYYHEGWGDSAHTNNSYGHNGFDVGATTGTSVYAAASGTAYRMSDSARGNYIVIEHPLGNGWSYYSYYQHLNSFAVNNGVSVSVGTTIGYVGSTGDSSGAHLHFGMVLGQSGLAGSAPNNLEGNGWVLTSGLKKGRIVVNPALNSPCGFPTGSAEVVPPLRAHAGSVMYTFNKNNVAIGDNGSAYLSLCTEYPSYLTAHITASTTLNSLPCSASTDSGSTTVATLSAGAVLNVTALYKNTVNNYWYKCTTSDGKSGYVFAGAAAVDTFRYDDVSISDVSAPSTLSVGDRFSIKGTVKSTINKIHVVNGYIYHNGTYSGSSYIYGETVILDGRSYSLLNGAIDMAMKFNELTTGAYNYVINAGVWNYYSTDGNTIAYDSNNTLLVSKPFTVGNISWYYTDVSALLDGSNANNTEGYGTFDMYINGLRVANDATDYYVQWPAGTAYEVNDIRAASGHTYMGVTEGAVSGTTGNALLTIRLSFVTGVPITDTPIIATDFTVYTTSEPVTLTRNTVAHTDYYWIFVYRDDVQVLSAEMPNTTYVLSNLSEGRYSVYLQVGNMTGELTSEPCEFFVEDQHHWDEGEVLQQPTCTAVGRMRYTCSICGSTMEESIPKLDHSYSYAVTTAPTTTATGLLTGTCSRCGGTTTVTLPKLSTTDYNYTVVTAATCTAAGTGRYTWKTTTYGTFSFNVTIPVLGHDYSYAVTTAPTTTTTGLLTGTCSRCGGTTTVTLPKLSTTDYNYTVVTAATCTAAGTGRYTWKTTTYGTFSFNVTIPELGHDYSYAVTTAPTTTTTGLLTGTCSRCSSRPTVTLPKLSTTDYNYSVVTAATCTATGTGRYTWKTTTYGSFSFTVTLPLIPHSYVDEVTPPTCASEGYTTHTCSVCGYSYTDAYTGPTPHSYSYAVTTAPTTSAAGLLTGTCPRCESTTTITLPKLSTTDYNYSVVTAATCTATGTGRYTWKTTAYGTFAFDVTLSTIPHSYVETVTAPTCTAQGYTTHRCSVCGSSYTDSYTPPLGHAFSYDVTAAPTSSATGTLTGTCSRCSETLTVNLPKLSTVDYDYTIIKAPTCISTGTARYTWKTKTYGTFSFQVVLPFGDHTYENVVTPPTCTARGYTTHTCSVCGESYRDSFVAALGHDYHYEITEVPTSSATGTLTGTCSRCGDTEPVTLPKLSTANYTYVLYAPATCTADGTESYTWKNTEYGTIRFDFVLPMLGHDYVAAVTEPGCTEGGYTTHTCSRCGDSYVDGETGALGHSFGSWAQSSTPTCTEPGYITRSCSRCGETESIEIAPLGHLPGEAAQENYTAPTPTQEGGYDTVVRCTRCNAILSSEHTTLPATGSMEPIETDELRIFSSISVGTDMVVTWSARKADVASYEKFWIEVVKHTPDGDETYLYGADQDEALDESTSAWQANFRHIFAKEMGVDIEARVYAEDANGQIYRSPAKTTNIRDYLGGRLTATNNTVSQRVLAADLLNYGAAAQIFMNYDTGHLVNEELTAEQLAKLDEYETKGLPPVEKTNSNYRPAGASNILFNSVSLGNEVLLTLTVRAAEGNDVKVLMKDHESGAVLKTLDTVWNGSTYTVDYTDIGADKMRVAYDFTAQINGAETGNIRTWSVEGYVGELRSSGNQLQIDVANALLIYGDSAAAYFAAQ